MFAKTATEAEVNWIGRTPSDCGWRQSIGTLLFREVRYLASDAVDRPDDERGSAVVMTPPPFPSSTPQGVYSSGEEISVVLGYDNYLKKKKKTSVQF